MNNVEGTTWWAMGLDNSQFETDVNKSNALFRSIGNTAENEGTRIESVFRKVTIAAAGFFTFQQATSYARQIATVRGEFQQLEVAFNTMLGSKPKADALMAQVVETAAKTPFDLQGVASGAKQLLAYGVASEEVTQRLTQLGNIAAGLSIPLNDIVYLYGTTMVQGRLFTQDVRQFMGRGIPLVKELAKELGKTENEINAMVTAGKIGFPEVQKVLDNLTGSGGMFHNLMEEQSKTISGKISNLGDNVSTMLNDIGKAQEGTINTVLDGAAYIVENYEEIGTALKELIVTYGAYKAAIMTVAAAQKATTLIKQNAEAEELSKLLTVEQQAVISKQNLTKGTAEYAAAVKAEITAEMEKQTAIATSLNTEVASAREALAVRKEQQMAAMQLVESRKQELASVIETAKSEKVAVLEKEIALTSEKQSRAALRAQKLQEQKDIAISEAAALKEAGASAEVVAAKNREIAAINAKLVAAKREEIQCSQLIVAKRAEIKTIDSSVASKQIEAAQNRLNSALQSANTAELNKNSAARALNSKRAALDSAIRKANTLETGMNTAAQAANVTTTNILATAKLKLTAIAAKLNAVVMANPWAIALAAVAALAYGIYKLITYQTDAEKAQAKLNQTVEESNRAIDAERLQIDAMFARMKAAKKGTEEYKAAKDAILNKYGDYLKSLGNEKEALDDLAKAYKLVTQEAEKAARAKAMETATKDASETYAEKKGDARKEVKELLDKKFKGKKGEDGMSLSETYFWKIEPVLEGKAEITKEIQDIISQFDKQRFIPGDPMTGAGAYTYTANDLKEEIIKTQKARKIFEDTMAEARIQFGENLSRNPQKEEKPEAFDPKGKSIAEIEEAIAAEQAKLDAFKNALKENNGVTEDGKAVTEAAVQAQEKYVDSLKKTILEREKDLKIIREVEDRIAKLKKDQKETVKDSEEYKELQSRIDSLSKHLPATKSEKESKDYSDDVKKNAQEEIRLKKDMEFAVRQAQLNARKDSFEKTMEQNQLNYEQEMEQLRRQKEDKLNKIQEWEKTVWQSKGKKGKFTPTTKELSGKENEQFEILERMAGEKFAKNNQAVVDEMLKQYESFAVKRNKINEKYDKDSSALISQKTTEQLKEAGDKMQAMFGNGNADLLARPVIDAIELVKKGWEDAGDGIATVYSSQFGVEDSTGKKVEILVSPILPDGSVLSPGELEDYVDNVLNGSDAILQADTKKLVLSVGVDDSGEAGDLLHQLQEEYYNLRDLIASGGGNDTQINDALVVLEQKRQEELEAVDAEIAKREESFNIWAERITNLGLKQLKAALQSARVALDKDGGNLSEKEKAVLRTKIKTLEKQIKVGEAKDASLTSAEKSKKKWGDTLKLMNEVGDTVNNIVSDFDGLDEVTKTALTAATNISGGIISMITGIQALSVAGAEAIKGVERASVILAIVGTAISLITTLLGMSSKAEKEHQQALKEVAENKLKMQREYNLLLMEQNLLMKEATSIFGEDQIAKAARAIEVYRQAISDYKAELKGEAPTMSRFEKMFGDITGNYQKKLDEYNRGVGALSNVTVKTGSYTTGAWFWKKQHDIMTPVLDVYEDLIDAEGNLNVERAKAIIETQTMSDENKALMQNLIDLQEQAKKAQEELRDYLQNTFGSLGEDIMTSITEAIQDDGVNAWERFGEKGSAVLEDLGKQIAYSLFFSDKFKRLQADLEKIYGSGKTEEEIAKDARDLVASFYNGIGTDMQNAQNWMQQWKEEANKQGFNLWETSREGTTKGIAAADQESVDELNGRATAIQGHTFLISEAMKELTSKMGKVLEYLSGIQTNTEHCKHLETINGNIKEMKEGIDSINTKGVIMKR